MRLTKRQLREVRGSDVAMVFQEPSTRAEPGLHGRLADRRGPPRPRQAVSKPRHAKGDRDPRPGRHPRSREAAYKYYPHQFSGGQKQRIVIAMALVLNPGLIVADEPTTALDVTVQAEILDLLRRCRDEFGAAIVLITHNMGVVADLADRVAVMYQGKVVEEADVKTLFSAPQDPYTEAAPRIRAARRAGLAADPGSRGGTRHETGTTRRPVVKATDLRIQYPGRMGQPGFVAVDGVSLRDPCGRSARARRRERFGQDDDRPGHRRPHPGDRRFARGARHRDERCLGAPVQEGAQRHRVRLPGSGVELQPAADDRGVRGRAARRARQRASNPRRRPGSRERPARGRAAAAQRTATASRTS